jgi:hypothetical protein
MGLKTKNRSQTNTSEVGIMARNLMTLVSRTLQLARPASKHTGRWRTGLSVESLEYRLSLSGGLSAGKVSAMDAPLNPQPIPPGRRPPPMIVGNHIGTPQTVVRSNDLNPQPLPPGVMSPMIQGAHIGVAMIQGNHIGTAQGIIGNHGPGGI